MNWHLISVHKIFAVSLDQYLNICSVCFRRLAPLRFEIPWWLPSVSVTCCRSLHMSYWVRPATWPTEGRRVITTRAMLISTL